MGEVFSIDYVKHEIDKGRPVLIPVDLNELSYNPMYKKEHRYKYMIIKGYDIERELFYILDNIHIDFGSATILTDFTSRFDEMYSMNHSFYEFFASEAKDLQHFYSLDASDKKRINSYTSKVDVKQNIGDDIHSGIIVKFSDGYRYLFGNYRGERTALFCPNLEEDFSIYECLNFDNNMEKEDKSNSYFKVVYTGEELEFHCFNIDTLVDECIYKIPTQGKDFSMGLFSKTWEKLDHTVRFYDISII